MITFSSAFLYSPVLLTNRRANVEEMKELSDDIKVSMKKLYVETNNDNGRYDEKKNWYDLFCRLSINFRSLSSYEKINFMSYFGICWYT